LPGRLPPLQPIASRSRLPSVPPGPKRVMGGRERKRPGDRSVRRPTVRPSWMTVSEVDSNDLSVASDQPAGGRVPEIHAPQPGQPGERLPGLALVPGPGSAAPVTGGGHADRIAVTVIVPVVAIVVVPPPVIPVLRLRGIGHAEDGAGDRRTCPELP